MIFSFTIFFLVLLYKLIFLFFTFHFFLLLVVVLLLFSCFFQKGRGDVGAVLGFINALPLFAETGSVSHTVAIFDGLAAFSTGWSNKKVRVRLRGSAYGGLDAPALFAVTLSLSNALAIFVGLASAVGVINALSIFAGDVTGSDEWALAI